ncbi:hypothetical protein ABBQ38_009845 [Trebouxia sp. C0009 RCD-2024]
MVANGDVAISFDQEYQVRILDAGKYEATQRLQQNCVTLTTKVEQLSGLVKTYLKILDKQADNIEIEKLKAISVRNAVATLEEDKKRKAKDVLTQLHDKQQQLERLNIQEASLLRARQDQDALIAKLTDSISYGSD